MNQRQCIILQGNKDWCRMASATLLADYDLSQTLWLTDNAPENSLNTTQKKAQSQLGKEFDAIVFDGLDGFNPDSFGVIVGTVKQGGAMILYLDLDNQISLFMQRFKQVFSQFEQQHQHFLLIQQGQELAPLTPVELSQTSAAIVLTDDQQQAVEGILRVVYGHRRRPLVLSADRGRGKSSCLGIAASQLLNEGKQKILVTAPSLATVATVFEHAHRLLPDSELSSGLISLDKAEIRFVAPDVLIESDLSADLLLVDEAAAIPASMLEKLVQKYSRIVFSTTLHGYEGTGRGFAVRFQQTLDTKTPNWHHYRMTTPLRWAKNDSVEAFSFESLLLDAEAVNDDLISDAKIEHCHFECVDRQALINNEQDLRALFGLMVLAHYRTRPSDLQMMLDRDDVSVYVMRYQGHIVASAWLVKEGQLDDGLSSAIFSGQRRLKGHLLPQSLLAHAGMADAGSLNYQRVIRIAVHPQLQHRGLGQQLMTELSEYVNHQQLDIIGTSFSLSDGVLSFWQKCVFSPVRLGMHQDEVSGGHAVMMLKAISVKGEELLRQAEQRFSKQWPQLVLRRFAKLEPQWIISLSQQLIKSPLALDEQDRLEIEAFSQAQRGYDFSQIALEKLVNSEIREQGFIRLSYLQQSLCVMIILQNRDFTEVTRHSKLIGKKKIIAALRVAIQQLLVNKAHVGK